eukprot:TRINITY_DN10371_c0_g1_i3.p1 TRINITY_DN10371_c0_g1~~TRINITY_DN10371_c0_g1_i3.p1  ORF type:complete len:109 (-),score=21.47 TRINITY_DN10371_c0_g1_i3:10-336(-)
MSGAFIGGDSNTFRLLAKAKQVPQVSSISYEGVFNEHWYLGPEDVKTSTSSSSSPSSSSSSTSSLKVEHLTTPVGGYASFIESLGDKKEIGRAVQQECRDRSRMPSSA